MPMLSDSFPKYPLLIPAVTSATPSSMPIRNTEKPMLLRYTGIIGYSISLAASVSRLIKDNIQMVRVKYFMTQVYVILHYSP